MSRVPNPVSRVHDKSMYRGVLNTPGITRAHDFQRIVSYGLGILLSLLVDFPPWRAMTVLVITSAMFGGAVWRLIRGGPKHPYALAQLDQLAAGLAIALTTGSFVITTGSVAFVSAAIAATFVVPARNAIGWSLVTGLPPIVISLLLGGVGSSDDAAYIAALVLIAVMLALTAFIVGLFVVQTRNLKQELSHRESQLSALLDVTPVVLAAVNDTGQLTTLAGNSQAWDQLVGDTITPESELGVMVAAAALTGRSHGDVAIGTNTFNVTCDRSTDGQTLLTVYDITAGALARRHLEEVVRSKDQFIAAVSHELRTPLASVVGFSELLREQIAAADSLRPMVDEVADQSAEMAAIIDDLLIAARSSFEDVPTQPRQINLADETSAVLEALAPRLATQPETRFDDAMAHADPIRVRQIIRNLVTNADRYGGEQVRVQVWSENGHALIAVRDSGAPVPEHRRAAMFEPYQSSGPVGGQPAAIGLGLTVSRTLAELMGGGIDYDHDGEWSSFELRLPRLELDTFGA